MTDLLGDMHTDNLRGAPLHPQIRRQIVHWHQSMKIRVLLENDFLPGDMDRQLDAFVDCDNNLKDHESLGTFTPADGYHDLSHFGNTACAREEIVAELTCCFPRQELGCRAHRLETNASYLDRWLPVLRLEKNAIFKHAAPAPI